MNDVEKCKKIRTVMESINEQKRELASYAIEMMKEWINETYDCIHLTDGFTCTHKDYPKKKVVKACSPFLCPSLDK